MDHENVRHPVRTVEHEIGHLREVADEGESPATPAILLGTVAPFVWFVAAIVLALALGAAYLATRGGTSQSGPAPAISTTTSTTAGNATHTK